MSPDMPSEPTGDPEEPRGGAPVHAAVIPLRGLGAIGLTVVATWLGLMVLDRGRTVLSLLVGGLAAALLTAPAVARLGRWMPRALAVLLVVLVGVVGTITLAGTIAWDVDRQADELSDAIAAAIDALPPDGALATIAAETDLATQADDLLDGVAAQLVVGDEDPLAAAGLVSKVVLVAVLAAFMVTQGPPLVAAMVRSVRHASAREEIHDALAAARLRGTAHVRRTVAVSAAHGLFAGVVVGLLDAPGAITLGAWVALAATVPILGGPLAWAPVLAVAWAVDVPVLPVAALGLAAVVVDRTIRARWVRPCLHIGPVLTLVGIGVGLYTLGIPGALVGLVAVAALAAAADPGVTDVGEIVEHLVDQPVPDRATPGVAGGVAGGGAPEPVPALVDETPDGPVLRIRLSRRTALAAGTLVIAAMALFRLVVEVQGFLVWLVVGSFIAIGLDRPVAALERAWRVPRVAGTALVLGGVAAVFGVVGYLAGPSITDSADEIVADAPAAVEALESLPLLGPVLEENDVSGRLEEEIAGLPDRIRDSHLVDRVVEAAGDGLVGAFWIISVVLAVLLDGPRLVDVARRRVPAPSRRGAVRFGRASYTSLSNIAAASAFVAVLNGTVVMLIAVALGVPLPPVLGLWAAWWNVIPQVGGFVGAAPLVVLAVGQGPWHGVIALAVFVAYQTFENHVIQPAVGGKAVKLPPLVILVGVLLGGSLFGFVGAILAGPALGVAKVAFDELRGEPPPRIEDRPPVADLSP